MQVDYMAQHQQTEVDQLRLQLSQANQKIMNLEMANMKLSDERVAIDHAQTIIKNLDQVPIYMYKHAPHAHHTCMHVHHEHMHSTRSVCWCFLETAVGTWDSDITCNLFRILRIL